jgi:hypothetical protein
MAASSKGQGISMKFLIGLRQKSQLFTQVPQALLVIKLWPIEPD